MLVLIGLLLALIPAAVIAYPFLRGGGREWLDDESSAAATLQRRWDAALDGIRSAELERAVGNLADADYRWLRRQYMREAAVVMRAMDLEREQEEAMLSAMDAEARRVRERVLGEDAAAAPPQDSVARQDADEAQDSASQDADGQRPQDSASQQDAATPLAQASASQSPAAPPPQASASQSPDAPPPQDIASPAADGQRQQDSAARQDAAPPPSAR